MTLNASDETATETLDYDCGNCQKAFPIPYLILVNNLELWELLENGTLLDAECPHCSAVCTTDCIVHFAISDFEIGELYYIPLHALNSDDVCEFLLEERRYQTTFYSIEELVCQVKARSRLVDYLFKEMADHPEYIDHRWPYLT